MFVKGDKYIDQNGVCWMIDYEGVSCCGNDVVALHGEINGEPYGCTIDRPEAYKMRNDGRLSKFGQMDLFLSNAGADVLPSEERAVRQ